MAKTIHDLAVVYGKEHQGTVDIEVFEDGAKTVLDIIENCYDWYDPLSVTGDKVRKKIKELKG